MHKHTWMVYSTSITDACILVKCNCGASGVIENPTQEEWDRAFYAPSDPYEWTDAERVKGL